MSESKLQRIDCNFGQLFVSKSELPAYLKVTPGVIRQEVLPGQGVQRVGDIHLSNDSDMAIAYKVKTTGEKLYAVSSSQGVLESGGSVRCLVKVDTNMLPVAQTKSKVQHWARVASFPYEGETTNFQGLWREAERYHKPKTGVHAFNDKRVRISVTVGAVKTSSPPYEVGEQTDRVSDDVIEQLNRKRLEKLVKLTGEECAEKERLSVALAAHAESLKLKLEEAENKVESTSSENETLKRRLQEMDQQLRSMRDELKQAEVEEAPAPSSNQDNNDEDEPVESGSKSYLMYVLLFVAILVAVAAFFFVSS